jgi:hypothetical protein
VPTPFSRWTVLQAHHGSDGEKLSRVQNAETLIVAWARIMPDVIDRAWDIDEGEWQELAFDEDDGSDEEFRPRMTREDLQGLI